MSDKSTKKKDDKKLAKDTKVKDVKDSKKASAKKASSKDSSKKPNPFKSFGKALREYRSELKKISWPAAKDTTKNALITLGAILVVGIFIWCVDFGLNSLRDVALEKIPQWSIFSHSDSVSDSDAAGDGLIVSGGDAADAAAETSAESAE